jgi:hypothetical protein
MKVHKVTAILKVNGFTASKSTWVREGNARRKVRTPGYKASQHGSMVGIECAGCRGRDECKGSHSWRRLLESVVDNPGRDENELR